MATQASTAELVAALYRVDGKAEIVGGEIVLMSPTGGLPSSAAAAIYRSLWDYARRGKSGRAYTDNTGFLVDLPQRKSFSPDASFYVGPPPGPKLLPGAPVFRATAPDTPTVYRRGERAEAETALPGWSFPVDGIFE